MRKLLYIFHDVDGKKYFSALEKVALAQKYKVIFASTNPFLVLISSILKKKYEKGILKLFLDSIRGFEKLFMGKSTMVLLGLAPFDLRILIFYLIPRKHKIIYHSSWPYWQKARVPKGRFTKRIGVYLWRRFLGLPNLTVVGVIREVINSIEAFVGKKINSFVIPHSVDCGLFLYRGESKKEKSVLFVGRLEREKGIHIFLRIARQMRSYGYVFTVVGNGIFKREVIKHHEKGFVIYKGVLNRDELAVLMKQTEYLIVPSVRRKRWEELFGMVIIEGQCAGNIVIASEHIGPKFIIVNSVNGFLVKDGDVEAIKRILLKLSVKDKNFIQNNAIDNGRKYSLDKIKKEWRTVL